jgi:putative PIN family toxin of toxin-antitoxin system
VSVLRLVLDTNVWLDWLVFYDPAVVRLRHVVADGAALIFMDEPCRAELERVLGYTLRNRKVPLTPEEQAAALARALGASTLLDSPARSASTLPACRDPDDQKFLELAAAAPAHVLLTRDKELLRLRRRRSPALPFRILTPTELVPEDTSAAIDLPSGEPRFGVACKVDHSA